jgi:hypothetical protein
MIIPIQSSAASSDPPEWAMLELNGELLAPAERGQPSTDSAINDDLLDDNQVELGSIHFTEEVR